MNAIKPDRFMNMPSMMERDVDAAVTPDELALNSLSKSRGWKVFKELAKQALEDMENVNKQAIFQGLSLEEIGQNAVVVSLAQGVIERLLNKVSDAVEACEKNE